MAKFLNTTQMAYWLPKLVQETKRELIIIVPYIKTSEQIYKELQLANSRGVETTLVYRENKMSDTERQKLYAIDNLNLMHHPNVHAKCYYNEKYLIIGSMNLYDFSEKNNREMGVLLHRERLEDISTARGVDCDDEQLFKDAILEIRNIINSSEMERPSIETTIEGFEMDIIKTDKEVSEEYCKKLNKHFIHKRFEAVQLKNGYEARCINYFDKIDIIMESRVVIVFKFEEQHLKTIYGQFSFGMDEFMFDGFKFYWNYYNGNAYLYKNTKHSFWKTDKSPEESYTKFKEAIHAFGAMLKPLAILR